jgi:hypothetical protein
MKRLKDLLALIKGALTFNYVLPKTGRAMVVLLGGKRIFVPKGAVFAVGNKLTKDSKTWPDLSEFTSK